MSFWRHSREAAALAPTGALPVCHHRYGSAEAELFTTRVRLSEGAARLHDSDGWALVIHANPDDHLSQPIGGAGPRVAQLVVLRRVRSAPSSTSAVSTPVA